MTAPRPDFTGIWRVDLARSQLKIPPPREMVMRITHREPEFVQDVRTVDGAGGVRSGRFAGVTGGTEFTSQIGGAPSVSRAAWDGTELTIRSLLSFGGNEIELADIWSLSGDGAEMRMEHRSGMLAGQITILTRVTDPAEAGIFDG